MGLAGRGGGGEPLGSGGAGESRGRSSGRWAQAGVRGKMTRAAVEVVPWHAGDGSSGVPVPRRDRRRTLEGDASRRHWGTEWGTWGVVSSLIH